MAVISLTDYRPSERYDADAWTSARIDGSDAADGTWTEIETITLTPVDTDPTDPQLRNFTTALVTDETWLRVVFIDDDDNEEPTLPVQIAPTGFVTVGEIETRIGRPLTDPEEATAALLADQITALVSEAVGRDEEWAAGYTAPAALRLLCVEVCARTMSAPLGVRSQQEQIGAYSHSESYPDALAGGLTLTDAEERRARRIVFGAGMASAKAGSILDDIWPDEEDIEGS